MTNTVVHSCIQTCSVWQTVFYCLHSLLCLLAIWTIDNIRVAKTGYYLLCISASQRALGAISASLRTSIQGIQRA